MVCSLERKMKNLAIVVHLTISYQFLSMFTVSGAGAHPSSHGNRVRRVVNGEETDIQHFPHQVQILRNGELICGGSIISCDWVLTAAHCIEDGTEGDFTIISGSSHLYEGEQHDVKTIVGHEDFSMETIYNDIAVMQVEIPFDFDENTQPIELVEPEVELDPHTHVTVTGWGYMEQDGELSDVLREAPLYTVPNEECKENYNGVYDVEDSQLCAQFTGEQKGSCQGDSGGPLITDDYKQVGVVSTGKTCADSEHPALFSKVSHYRNWINSITGV